ncbi:hypothetical protein [Agromyces aerolatus]|uniref:hypothetical protein n=1 Tax=Agromyces sp. LY-1074 TaxID=3074080 RepID=UPI002861B187|nr:MULTISPECIES: hypothetical protein [unclassified Agromyces]MDR5701239.1 hypothetical protein [Agromyces sp. LY-1074]MDR5706885.1 hypothetical protein [Agromyces sp. LY-1358]
MTALLWAAVPANAADEPAERGAIEVLDQPKPPTEREREAARTVKAYLDTTPHPATPGPNASADERAAYGPASLRWLQNFPYRAGWAQWNCEALEWKFGMTRSTVGEWDIAVVDEVWFACPDLYIPPMGDIYTPRPDAIDPTVEFTAAPPTACTDIRSGWHCFQWLSKADGTMRWMTSYTWQGAGPTTGRIRVGSAPPVWPACTEGTPINTGAIRTLSTGVSVAYEQDLAPGTIKSISWDDADANGNILGTRSVVCALEPEYPFGEG